MPYHQCDKLLGLAKGLENHQIAWKTTSEIIRLAKMYMLNDVVTDWSYALAGFLVSTLFSECVACSLVMNQTRLQLPENNCHC